LRVGGYLFLDPDGSGTQQAEEFIDLWGPADPSDLFFVDFEKFPRDEAHAIAELQAKLKGLVDAGAPKSQRAAVFAEIAAVEKSFGPQIRREGNAALVALDAHYGTLTLVYTPRDF